MIEKARRFATVAHGVQRYGAQCYPAHLATVVATLRKYDVEDENILAAAWLHDVVEDTTVTLDTIRTRFGDDIAALVDAVTTRPGASRRERTLATLPALHENDRARLLKLADRVANVEASWKAHDWRLFLYYEEHKIMRPALLPVAPCASEASLWIYLDALLGYRAMPDNMRSVLS